MIFRCLFATALLSLFIGNWPGSPLVAEATSYYRLPERLYIKDDCICIEPTRVTEELWWLSQPFVILVCSGAFLGRSPGAAYIEAGASSNTQVVLRETVNDAYNQEFESRTTEHEVLAGFYFEDRDSPKALEHMNLLQLDPQLLRSEDTGITAEAGVIKIPLSSLDEETRSELAADRCFIAVSTWYLGLRLFRIPGGQLNQVNRAD
ncbi:hypothetical protein IT575_14760 [bacterium]|nr:hypothetical protein [bacterium]